MRLICASLVVVGVLGSVCLADWPQFQGPAQSGVSPEKGFADTWPATGPKELWKSDLSNGFGGPAIQGGKVYLMDRTGPEGQEKDVIRCLDFATGKEDWNFEYDAPGKFAYPGSRSTPAVDDKYVYTIGPWGHFYCLDKKTHKPLWTKNLLSEYNSSPAGWKVAQSPCLYKNMVIVAPQGKNVGVVAFDKAKGTELWKSEPVGTLAYSSPYVTTIDGVEQVIVLGQRGDNVIVSGIDVKQGKLLWTYSGYKCSIPIADPIAVGDGKFFLTAAYGAGSAMFQVKRQGSEWAATQVFRYTKDDPNAVMSWIHDPIVYNGFLYANSSTGNGKGLVCMSLDGKIQWSSGKQGFDNGNLVIADGKIYIMEGNRGVLHMIKATAEGYQPLAKAPVLAGNLVWAPMAISDGKLICRDQKQVKCLDLKSK